MKKAYPEDRFPKPAVPAGPARRRPKAEPLLQTKEDETDIARRRSATWGVHQQEEQN